MNPKFSNTVPAVPEIAPSSSITHTCNSSLVTPTAEAAVDVPGAASKLPA